MPTHEELTPILRWVPGSSSGPGEPSADSAVSGRGPSRFERRPPGRTAHRNRRDAFVTIGGPVGPVTTSPASSATRPAWHVTTGYGAASGGPRSARPAAARRIAALWAVLVPQRRHEADLGQR